MNVCAGQKTFFRSALMCPCVYGVSYIHILQKSAVVFELCLLGCGRDVQESTVPHAMPRGWLRNASFHYDLSHITLTRFFR